MTELATSSLVLAAFGAGSTMEHAEQLTTALQALCNQHHGSTQWQRQHSASVNVAPPEHLLVMRMTPREAHFALAER